MQLLPCRFRQPGNSSPRQRRELKAYLVLWQRVLKILDTRDKHAKLTDKKAALIDTLRDAVNVLLTREEMLLAKIEAAAAKPTADMAGRLGSLEGPL